MRDEFFTGVLPDLRTPGERAKDHAASEVMAETPVVWKERTEEEMRLYPVWDQFKTGACVAFTKAKQISIRIFMATGVWIDISPASIYQLRINRPGEGMYLSDANDITNNSGATLEAFMKSQGLTEEQIDLVKRTRIADLFAKAIAEAVVQYRYIAPTMEDIARAIERKGQSAILLFAQPDEYTDKPTILYPNLVREQARITHCVTGVFHHVRNGQKLIRIADSWGQQYGNNGHRDLTEEFIRARVTAADYLDIFELDTVVPNTQFRFDRDLTYGMKQDKDVVQLQDMLKYEGFFSANDDSTGNYGNVTAKAVLEWQIRHGVDTSQALANLGGKSFGPKSRKVANKIYA